MSRKVYNVLFLCTGNSARSILGEVLLNELGGGRFRAFSAGSQPKGAVHPEAVRFLSGLGYATEGLRSKSWDEFADPTAPKFDFIFTVCDNAAGETCPVWIGHPTTAHWGIDDPAAADEGAQADAFREAARLLRIRIDRLLALPVESLDAASLAAALKDIGRSEGATRGAA